MRTGLSNLPPGTISPVMISSMLAAGSRREYLLHLLRHRATGQAVMAAQAAAETAQQASRSALAVVEANPALPEAEQTVQRALGAQHEALEHAAEAERAAYHLRRLRQIRADQLPSRRHTPKPRPGVAGI